MICTRFTVASLCIVLLGYQPLAALGQSQTPSGVRTSLTDRDPVDIGTVISRAPDSITVRNELFTRVFELMPRQKSGV
jgi:hypothetical protein